jgi:hypothetical protein
MTTAEALFAQAIFDMQKMHIPALTKEQALDFALRPSKLNPPRPRWHDFIAPELWPLLDRPEGM